MAETSTIARPYAQGVFKLAQASGDLGRWSEMLEFAAAVTRDPAMASLTGTSLVDRGRLAELFTDICGDRLDEQGRNLIRLLADNRRLGLLPAIAEQYERLRNDAEGVVEATLYTAKPIDDDVRAKLAEAIGKRLSRKVELSAETDEELLGGAVLRAGDLVIDGSARGQLERMAATLSR
jgi:F-type H+-transporting ATPase subunit delta